MPSFPPSRNPILAEASGLAPLKTGNPSIGGLMGEASTLILSATVIPTVAHVLADLEHRDLSKRARQSRASALRRISQWFGKAPHQIRVDPRLLRPALNRLSAPALGVSRQTLRNYRSLALSAVAQYCRVFPGRYLNPLSPKWAALTDQLTTPASRYGTSAFVHCCSAGGIEPENVTEQTFEEYRLELLNSSYREKPERAFSLFCQAWSKAQRENQSWPRAIARCPKRRDHWVFPWDRFPESLHRDARIWLNRLAGRDLEEGPARPVRPATLKHREWQIRVLATAAVQGGSDVQKLQRLADLVAVETLKAALGFLLARRDGTSTTGIADLAAMAKAVAKHYVGADADHLNRIGKMVRKLDPGRGDGLTEKVKTRLRQLKDPKNLDALLNLPNTLMCEAERTRNPKRGAVKAQMAVCIETCWLTALRRLNLVHLDIERNLVRSGAAERLHIAIEREAVKNRVALEFPIPFESSELFERYIRVFRPRLASPGNTALFPGINDGPKNACFLGTQVSRTIYKYTGIRWHPHLFRHAVAVLYLRDHPGDYETVRRFLGHRSIETTIRFYCDGETETAVNHFHQTILRRRKQPPPNPPRSRKPKRNPRNKKK